MLREELRGLEKQIEECLTVAYMKGYNKGRNETDYLRGLKDAWECAKDIFNMPCDKKIAIFGSVSGWVKDTPAEAMLKIKKYKNGKDINAPNKDEEIKIGDEMCSVTDSSLKIIVIDVDTLNDCLTGYGLAGTYSGRPMKHWRKTGRHCSKIEEIAEWLNNENEVEE